MRSRSLGLALFVFGLSALGVNSVHAGSDVTEVVAAALKQGPKYQRWVYDAKAKTWDKKGKTHDKHKDLHKHGKGEGRTHVHPKYWDKMYTVTGFGGAAMPIFTVTLEGDSPVATPTDPLPKFCLYHCEDKWRLKGDFPTYQEAYESAMNDMLLDFLTCTETCAGVMGTATHFTVCADQKETLYGGKKCCDPDSPPPMYPPPVVLYFIEPPRKHCCILDRLRSRRMSGPGCR